MFRTPLVTPHRSPVGISASGVDAGDLIYFITGTGLVWQSESNWSPSTTRSTACSFVWKWSGGR